MLNILAFHVAFIELSVTRAVVPTDHIGKINTIHWAVADFDIPLNFGAKNIEK